MNRSGLTSAIVLLLLTFSSAISTGQSTTPGAETKQAQSETLATYCITCHSDRRKTAGLSLSQFDVERPTGNLDVAERVIRKLRTGMMPPAGAKRPEESVLTALADSLERTIDSAPGATNNAGARTFQRLNRAEYAQSIRDLVGVDIDPSSLLPPDTISAGFDNIADVQTFSPTLVTSYLRAASQVSSQAVARESNRRVFSCFPRRPADEGSCAKRIITDLAQRAFRGTATPEDLRDATLFYEQGRARADFREGVRLALQSILVSPRFIFRLEPFDFAQGKPASSPQTASGHRQLDDRSLASRLSFFLWGRAPDADLLEAADRGLLRPGALDRQVRRMLVDRRSMALASRFARQWLRLQDLESVVPNVAAYPGFDRQLAASMRTETELFFDSIVREDRSVLELLTADYSFVDKRLAEHYGLPPVKGAGFVKVAVPESRRGLLGHGSILMATSLAERTSPVLRGKWVMEVLLGTPPPPPPPNVPALDDSAPANRGGVRLSTRQRVEEHRKNPQCNACHRFIDPLGLTLENFDVTGAWRSTDNQVDIDARGELYDGTSMDGPAGLRDALLARRDMVLRTFAENLLTYAIGRRLEASDMSVVRHIVTSAAQQNYRFSSFVKGVVGSAPFLSRTGHRDSEGTEGNTESALLSHGR